jgi:hypothetical protein
MVLALTVVGLTDIAPRAQAQTVQNLIQFTSNWRYDQSGRELGTAWRARTYVEDAQWQPLSPGLLGNEPDTPALYTVHAPISTPLVISTTVTTYYFRATFNFSGSTNGLVLIATNLVDDGCALYLNGTFVGGVRAPATYNAATFFTGPTTEGQLDVVNITALSALQQGQNVMAVEVHQSGAASSDVMFGMRLMAFIPTALTITNQPQSQTVTVGDSLNLSVGVSGGPVAYRWFKDGTFIPNATNATYSVTSVTANNAGSYRVVVSNILTVLTSSVATVTIVSDTTGPQMLAAIIANNTGTGAFATNTINVLWDEPLSAAGGAQNTNNYKLVVATNSNIRIPITRAVYSTALGTLLTVDSTNAYWSATGNYYLIVNNVADSRGNNINPNSVIGVSYLITSNLTQMADYWDFYSIAFFDPTYPDIYVNTTNPWYGTNYVVDYTSGLWGNGRGILFIDPNPPAGTVCADDAPSTLISYQNDPSLFRRTFNLPADVPGGGVFRFRFVVDDGLILYLNGIEIHRRNMPAGAWNQNTKALTTVTDFGCVTNLVIPVSGLRRGTNVLAAAVFQAAGAGAESDTWFGMEMDLQFAHTAATPTNSLVGRPTIALTKFRSAQTNYFVLSWAETNYGYSLMYSTNIVDLGYSYRNGAPISGNPGPNPARRWYTNETLWFQVPNQANPWTNPIPNGTPGPRRFYKLFRETLN